MEILNKFIDIISNGLIKESDDTKKDQQLKGELKTVEDDVKSQKEIMEFLEQHKDQILKIINSDKNEEKTNIFKKVMVILWKIAKTTIPFSIKHWGAVLSLVVYIKACLMFGVGPIELPLNVIRGIYDLYNDISEKVNAYQDTSEKVGDAIGSKIGEIGQSISDAWNKLIKENYDNMLTKHTIESIAEECNKLQEES